MRGEAAGGGRVKLSWSARADLDSGIKGFVIYCDGDKVGTFKGPESSRNPGYFQRGNFGDEPEPVVPAGSHRYQVATVNWSDLEGGKSAAVEITTL